MKKRVHTCAAHLLSPFPHSLLFYPLVSFSTLPVLSALLPQSPSCILTFLLKSILSYFPHHFSSLFLLPPGPLRPIAPYLLPVSLLSFSINSLLSYFTIWLLFLFLLVPYSCFKITCSIFSSFLPPSWTNTLN